MCVNYWTDIKRLYVTAINRSLLLKMYTLKLTSSLMQSNGSTGGDFKPHQPALDQRCQGNYGGGVSRRPLSAAARLKLLPSTVMQSRTVSLQKATKFAFYFHNTSESAIMTWCTQGLDTCRNNESAGCLVPRLPVSTTLWLCVFSQVYEKQLERVIVQEWD